jgi:hypothetical protein
VCRPATRAQREVRSSKRRQRLGFSVHQSGLRTPPCRRPSPSSTAR